MNDRDLLNTLTPDTRAKVEELLRLAFEVYGYRLKIVSARRTCQEQERLYAQGRTAPGNIVTNARGCMSWHVLGRAVDLHFVSPSPTPQDWENLGNLGESLGFVWGKNFKGLNDLPHFEYHPGKTIEEMCPDPTRCEQAVNASMSVGTESLSEEPLWPYVLIALSAGVLTYVLLE